MTEIWSPDNKKTDNPATSAKIGTLIEEIFAKIQPDADVDQYQTLISAMVSQQNLLSAEVGSQNRQFWHQHLENYSNGQIVVLIKFFTLAEEAISQWQFGSKSPVIDCAKILKSRQYKLEKELLGWIKSHSTNKFLPFGPL